VWLRRDLRLHDHPALAAALSADRLAVVFCLDDALLHGRHASGARTPPRQSSSTPRPGARPSSATEPPFYLDILAG
jgi:hypothetical protein